MAITGKTLETGLPGRSERRDHAVPVPCQICGATLRPGLDLGHQPVGDLILDRAQLNEPETYYPMQMHHCDTCGLTQLGYIVDPDVVYKGFPFVSGTTQTARDHLQSLPTRLVEMRGLDSSNFAVDIGSNDGTLLRGWVPHGVSFLGVDPSGDPVAIANEQGLTTWHAFFNESTAGKILGEFGKADAVTACGCFAHIADLDGIMKGIAAVLAEDGVFASDNQYWLDMVEKLHYDNAFHQHLRYYSLRPLQYLFGQYGLEVFDVERSDTYGGQIRVYGCHQGAHPIHDRVHELGAVEDATRLYDAETHARYTQRIEEKRRVLFETVYSLKAAGKKVIGIGAPAKASTVCTYCGLGAQHLDYITEINPLRVGTYLPGSHIPIIDEPDMFVDPEPADAGVLFAWNYADEVIPKLRERGWEGEIILP
jgi:SAM-dependent methyltransferase